MASTDKLMRARTKFKVINNIGSRFKMSMHAMVTGRYYYMPGQFTTYYGTADLSLDIRTYPGWKGELRSFLRSWEENTGPNYERYKGTYISYYLMPWSRYDLTRYYPSDLPIQSCILSYNADYLVDDTQKTANIENVEIMPSWDDLVGLQQKIGNKVRPMFPRFMYSSGGSTYTPVRKSSVIKTPLPWDDILHDNSYVVPVDMIEGVREDIYAGGTYKVTSTVNIELVE